MHILGRLLAFLFAPLASLTESLAPSFAAVAHRPAGEGDFAIAAIVVSSGVITVLCSFWAAGERVRNLHLRRQARVDAARAHSNGLFREALLAAGGQPIVVMGVDMATPMSFAGGRERLQSCLAGRDAGTLAGALDALLKKGIGFEHTVLSSDHRMVGVRGTAVGGRVAVFFRQEAPLGGLELDGRGVLDALPVPVWVRNKDLALRWVNRAFLQATGKRNFDDALDGNIAFDKSELELAAAARDDGAKVEAKRYAMVAGERRALSLILQPLDDCGVTGAAVDVTDVAQTEIKLQNRIAALHDVLDNFETAVAEFGPDRRLLTFNRAFARLWDLPEKWLRAHPTHEDVLDRLREERHLPEQRDFAAWKRAQTRLCEESDDTVEALWHLPCGKSLRVLARKNADCGVTFRFKDVSERLKLESLYATALKVQKAMLDTLEDGVAIIGPDGRVGLHNRAFARLWHLGEDELAAHPHIREVAELCAARIGRDHTWEIVASGVAAAEPERLNDWGKIGRADGRAISLTLARLPDGGTLATFTDLSEAVRFETELQRDSQAA